MDLKEQVDQIIIDLIDRCQMLDILIFLFCIYKVLQELDCANMCVYIFSPAFGLMTLGVKPIMRHVVKYFKSNEEAEVIDLRVEVKDGTIKDLDFSFVQ